MMSQCSQISEINYNKNAEIRSRLFETRIIPRSFMRAQRNDFVKVFKESLHVRCNADISRHLLPVSSPSLAADPLSFCFVSHLPAASSHRFSITFYLLGRTTIPQITFFTPLSGSYILLFSPLMGENVFPTP